jgi:hypothetical protein
MSLYSYLGDEMTNDQQSYAPITEEAARMAVVQFYQALQFERALHIDLGEYQDHISCLQEMIDDLEQRAPWLKQEVTA